MLGALRTAPYAWAGHKWAGNVYPTILMTRLVDFFLSFLFFFLTQHHIAPGFSGREVLDRLEKGKRGRCPIYKA